MINRKKFSIRVISLIFFILALDVIASKFHWYFTIWWFDMPMHFLGGIWVGLALLWYFPLKSLFFKEVFKIIFGVLIVAIFWEIFEILVDKVIAQNPFNALDTLSDIFFGMAGGVVSIFYFFRRIMIKRESKV